MHAIGGIPVPYHITEDCVACGGCAVVCPAGAIDDGYTCFADSRFYRIRPSCNQCGRCVEVCPTGAIIQV